MPKSRLTLLAALLLGASSSFAQDVSSPEYIEARQRLQEGKALYSQGNVDGARIKCEQACAVLKTPACLRALGLAQFYTKHYLEALGNLQKSLEDKELDTMQRKQVTDLMQQAYDKTGHLEIRAPAGGRVRIDESIDAGNAPLRDIVHVTVGAHVITVTVEEKTERLNVDCADGKIIKVDFTDKFPNSHIDDTHPPTTTMDHYRSTAGWLMPLTVGVVGLVGVGLGIGFAVGSQDAQSDVQALFAKGVCADQTSATCASYKNKIDAKNSDSAISIASYVAGGALVVTSAVLFAIWPKSERPKVTVAPSVSPTSAGLVLQARF